MQDGHMQDGHMQDGHTHTGHTHTGHTHTGHMQTGHMQTGNVAGAGMNPWRQQSPAASPDRSDPGRPRHRRAVAGASACWRVTLLLTASLAPAACAGGTDIARAGHTTYGVERLGHGAYSVRSHILGIASGVDDAKADNVRVATEYCAKKGLAMTAIGDRGYGGFAPQDTLTFRCGAPAADQHPADNPAPGT